jgi:hypothetical protein
VQIWSEKDRFICIADANRRIPANATDQDLREALKQKNQHRKLQKSFYEARPRLHEDLPDLVLRAAIARNADRPPEPPTPAPNIAPLRTPLEDQMPALQRAMDLERPLRKAAGAESMSLDSLRDAFKSTDSADRPTDSAFDLMQKAFSPFSYEPATDAASNTQEAYTPFTYERLNRADELETTP